MSRFWNRTSRLRLERNALCVTEDGASRRIEHDGTRDGIASALDAIGARGDGGRRNWLVALSDEMVRYLIVDWPAGLRGSVERSAFAAHRMREVHGILAPEWQIDVEPTVGGIPSVASAVPAAAMEPLLEWERRSGDRITRVLGEFVEVFNRVRKALEHPVGALALQRGGRVTVGCWTHGQWHSLRSLPAGPAFLALAGLPPVGESAHPGGECGVLYSAGAKVDLPQGWRMQQLEGWECD